MLHPVSTPKGGFYLNGEEIRLRGANMMGNLMQCVTREKYVQYAGGSETLRDWIRAPQSQSEVLIENCLCGLCRPPGPPALVSAGR
jgi:hypothetical protein